MKQPPLRPLHPLEHERLANELRIIAGDLERIGKRLGEAYGTTITQGLDRGRGNVLRTREAMKQRWALQQNGESIAAPAVVPASPKLMSKTQPVRPKPGCPA